MGGMTIAQMLWWVSEPAAGSLWPIIVSMVRGLKCNLVTTTLRLLGLGPSFSIIIPLPPSFLIHILLIPHTQITYELDKQVASDYWLSFEFCNFFCIFLWYLLFFII